MPDCHPSPLKRSLLALAQNTNYESAALRLKMTPIQLREGIAELERIEVGIMVLSPASEASIAAEDQPRSACRESWL